MRGYRSRAPRASSVKSSAVALPRDIVSEREELENIDSASMWRRIIAAIEKPHYLRDRPPRMPLAASVGFVGQSTYLF